MKMKNDNVELIKGDCLQVMRDLAEQGVKVDAVICDPPYGTTACKWDNVIPFAEMWECINAIIKPNAAICLFGDNGLFTASQVMSNPSNFRYNWVWKKNRATGFLSANKMPLNDAEAISVFYSSLPTYNPQMSPGEPYTKRRNKKEVPEIYGKTVDIPNTVNEGNRYPKRVLEIPRINRLKAIHPTEKPVALMEYLIKTYTQKGELVLDFTMGSGSTGLAAVNTGRKFIGIELDPDYFAIAQRRIEESKKEKASMLFELEDEPSSAPLQQDFPANIDESTP